MFSREPKASAGGNLLIYRDPKCVHVADSLSEAESVAHFLNGHGLPAQVMNPATLGGLLGLTVLSRTGVSSTGLEVWVNDPAHAEPALQKLQEFAAEQTKKGADKETQGQSKPNARNAARPARFPRRSGTARRIARTAGPIWMCRSEPTLLTPAPLDNLPFDTNNNARWQHAERP
jgi:hypothetical protein